MVTLRWFFKLSPEKQSMAVLFKEPGSEKNEQHLAFQEIYDTLTQAVRLYMKR